MNPSIEPPRRNLTGAVVSALAAAALAGLGTLFIVGNQPQRGDLDAPAGCVLRGLENEGGPLSLTDHNGNAVTQADFDDAPAVLYFGFTHCPDICPTAMYALGEALSAENGYDAQAVLISVDPARDTPEVLRTYVASGGFPPGLVGLTGKSEQIKSAAEAFGVGYFIERSETDPEAYNVNHTSFFYVMDSGWRLKAKMLSFGATPDSLRACIAAGLERD